MSDPNWPYPFAPPPQAAAPAPQVVSPLSYPMPVPAVGYSYPQELPPPAPVQAELASSPDWVICDHCGDVVEKGDFCFILTQAEVKRSEKSGRLIATEDMMSNTTPHFYLHEYCLHEFIMGEYVGEMLCENCGDKLSGG